MEKIQEISKIKKLLDDGALTPNEFEKLKTEILNGDTEVSTLEKKETQLEQTKITIIFKGQWFLFDAKTSIYVDGELISVESTKKGFEVVVPLKSPEMKIKVELGGMKSTTYELSEIDMTKNCLFELIYDNMWGKYSKGYGFYTESEEE